MTKDKDFKAKMHEAFIEYAKNMTEHNLLAFNEKWGIHPHHYGESIGINVFDLSKQLNLKKEEKKPAPVLLGEDGLFEDHLLRERVAKERRRIKTKESVSSEFAHAGIARNDKKS